MTGLAVEPALPDVVAAIHPDPTLAQAAATLGCCTKTARRMISRGQLRAYRLGPRMIRVRRDSLLAVMAARDIPTTSTS